MKKALPSIVIITLVLIVFITVVLGPSDNNSAFAYDDPFDFETDYDKPWHPDLYSIYPAGPVDFSDLYKPLREPTEEEKELVASLGYSVYTTEEKARESLITMGADAVPAIAYEMEHSDYWTRSEIISLFSELGPSAKDAVPALIAQLTEPRGWCGTCRYNADYAGDALVNIGVGAIPGLERAFQHGCHDLKREIIYILGRFQPDPRVVCLLSDALDDKALQSAEIYNLGLLGPGASAALEKLRDLPVDSSDSYSGEATALAIASIEGYQGLIEFLKKPLPSDWTKGEALGRLIKLTTEDRVDETTAMFVELLRSDNPTENAVALEYVAQISSPTDELVDALKEILRKDSIDLPLGYAFAALMIFVADEEKFPLIETASHSSSAYLRQEAIDELSALGIPDYSAEVLKAMLDDKDPDVSIKALNLLESAITGTDVADVLVGQLQSKNPEMRKEAITRIADYPTRYDKTVPILLEMVSDHEYSQAATRTLARIGPRPEIIAKLVESLSAGVEIYFTSDALGQMGKAAVLPLRDLLKNEDPEIKGYAARALSDIGKDTIDIIDDLITALEDPGVGVRTSLLRTIGKIGSGSPKAYPALLKGLEMEEPMVRKPAVDALVNYGPDAKGAVPVLLNCLASDYDLRKSVCLALNKIDPDAIDIVLFLRTELENKFGSVRITEAAGALAQLGVDGAPALSKMRDIEKNSIWTLIGENVGDSVKSLEESLTQSGAIPVEDPYAWISSTPTEELIQELDLSNRNDSTHAMFELSLRGKAADGAIPKIVEGLKDDDPWTRWVAAYTLSQLSPTRDSIHALVEIAGSADIVFVRYRAIRSLGELGPAAIDALPILINALDDPSPDIRVAAERAIVPFGKAAKDAAPKLLARLDDDFYPAIWAASGLGEMGYVPGVARALASKYWDSRGEVHSAISTAIVNLGADAWEAVPLFTEALDDPERNQQAVFFLGKIGPPASEAVPKIINTSKEDNPYLKLALAEIEGVDALKEYYLEADKAAPDYSYDIYGEKDARRDIIRSIGRLGHDAYDLMPWLIELLDNKDGAIRANAAEALGNIGPDAFSALDRLRELAATDDYIASYYRTLAVHLNASYAIRQIEGEWVYKENDLTWTRMW